MRGAIGTNGGRRSMADWRGFAWRLRGLWRDLRVAARELRRWRVPFNLRLIGRSPKSNGPVYLRRFGDGALAQVLAWANRHKIRPFVCFGTLLGFVRDGGFIAHDHDLDLGVLEEDWGQLKRALRSDGEAWVIRRMDDWQCTIESRLYGYISIDFFCFRAFESGFKIEAFDEERRFAYRFPRNLIVPLQEFHTPSGHEALTVCAIESFLASHYGPDWPTPDPGYDYRVDPPNRFE